MTIEEMLKSAGWTDAELETHKALIAEPKFRGAIETSLGAIAEERDKFAAENKAWAQWHEEHGKPTLALYEKDAVDAKAHAASLEARLKEAEKAGYAPRRDDQNPDPKPAAAAANEPFDPKKHKLVTTDDVERFADMEGRAIAMASDLNEEYRSLTGKSLIDYSTTIDGRTVRGMTALREEAKAAKRPLDQYVADKFKFNEHRDRIAAEARAKAEEAIRADERAKVVATYGNPDTRPLQQSKSPFIPPAPGGDAKHPWDVPAQERRSARLGRAIQSEMKGQVN